MNYLNIYKSFISDRKLKEADLLAGGDYHEVHHIRPRSLGGDNNPENLIALTPSDHFFAHLMLAKIHGGSQWAPIAFMVGMKEKYAPTTSRKKYDWARRQLAAATSGKMGTRYCPKKYVIVNSKGETLVGDQIDLMGETGISNSLMSMLVNGAVSVAKDWSLYGAVRKSTAGKKHPGHKKEKYHFKHESGLTFYGTQYDLNEKYGVGRPAISHLVSGHSIKRKGWSLDGADLNYRRGLRNGNARTDKFTIKNKVTGEVFTGVSSEVYKKTGLSRSGTSNLVNGLTKTTRCGWSLHDE